MCRARGRSRTHSVERRQASHDLRHDGVLGALGATAELAGNGARLPDQLGAVYRSVEWFVQWGLAHRELCGIQAIGVDEIHWGRGLRADNFLTVIYQIDRHCRRLLWVGRRRSQATLRRGLKALGPEVVKGLRFVCSDMWKPYLQVIAAQGRQALHVLDRSHITSHLNQAVDQVRRAKSTRLRGKSQKEWDSRFCWMKLR